MPDMDGHREEIRKLLDQPVRQVLVEQKPHSVGMVTSAKAKDTRLPGTLIWIERDNLGVVHIVR